MGNGEIPITNIIGTGGKSHFRNNKQLRQFCMLLPHKGSFVCIKFFLLFWCQDSHNDVKSNDVMCVYVKTLESSSFCISGITWPIKLKFGVHLK